MEWFRDNMWQTWAAVAFLLGVAELFSLDLVQGHDKLVGKTGTVVEEISADGGQVRIAGEVWSARPYDDDAVIEVGARVDVFQIRGATAVVHKIPEIE